MMIRLRAAIYLTVGNPLADLLESWVQLVREGWFSRPYLRDLTDLCFRMIGGLEKFLPLLGEAGEVPREGELMFTQPAGMASLLEQSRGG
jgi:hypothetical protein